MSKPVVAIQCATKMEAEPYVKHLQFRHIQHKPFHVYGGDSSLYIIISGIGISAAAIAATYAYTQLNADCIINAGAAGALTLHHCTGTVGTVQKVYDTTRYHLDSMERFSYDLNRLEHLPPFRCVSTALPLRTPDERLQYAPIADIVDMELAGIVQASLRFSKICCSIKYISDTSQHTTHEDIVKSISAVSQTTAPCVMEAVQSYIHHL